MNNLQVTNTLRTMIDELNTRLEELIALQRNPGGPLTDRLDRLARISERISSLNLRVFHLNNRLTQRELAASLSNAVPPLSAARVTTLQNALQSVSASIAATSNFKNAIALATSISAAASKAHDATS